MSKRDLSWGWVLFAFHQEPKTEKLKTENFQGVS